MTMSDVQISSFIVYAAPDAGERLQKTLQQIPGVTIAAQKVHDKLVIAFESDKGISIKQLLDRFQNDPLIVHVALVSQYITPAETVDEVYEI